MGGGLIYASKVASGPSSSAGPQNPSQDTTNTYWTPVSLDDNNVVHKTGDEVIDGVKTFQNTRIEKNDDYRFPVTALYMRNPRIERGTTVTTATFSQIMFLDAEGEPGDTQNGRLELMEYRTDPDGSSSISLNCYRFSNNSEDAKQCIGLVSGYYIGGTPYARINDVLLDSHEYKYHSLYPLNNDGEMCLCGGRRFYAANGSYIRLNGMESIDAPGHFFIYTGRANNVFKLFEGRPDGTLQWDGQNIQVSSDERIKTPLISVPDQVLDVWEEVNWGQFQYLDAIAEKGEDARLHLGLIAQKVKKTFEQHGLDACKYGILCHEEKEAKEEVRNDNGDVVSAGEPAIDLWMVRYAEAQAMEAAYQRRENRRLKEKVASLEERLANLESRLN